jgi:hypothetical protein
MRAMHIAEPELQFGDGRNHIDPRVGLTDYGPPDFETPEAPKSVRLGILGHRQDVASCREWITDALSGLPQRGSQFRNLFRAFPACDEYGPLRCDYSVVESLVHPIPRKDITSALNLAEPEATIQLTRLFADHLRAMSESASADVVVCVKPSAMAAPPDNGRSRGEPRPPEFHDLLKAKAMGASTHTQVVTEALWTGKKTAKRGSTSPAQDAATRAWNLFPALYYKAGGTPWRLPRSTTELMTCFVGISFYETLGRASLHTSVAQVFNERGDGVVVRGGPAKISKQGRQPFLDEDAAHDLLVAALQRYRDTHLTSPARVVVHKTSRFRPEEVAGFRTAADEQSISVTDMVWIQRGSTYRLFRSGDHPPLRGTALETGTDELTIYTRGMVPWYGTYPGMYVPSPIALRMEHVDTSPAELGAEVLALTKMNWNNSSLDGREPITTHTARRVGTILRHLTEHDPVQSRYSYFM